MDKKQIFLGKAGKVYGPYRQEEYDQLFASGELSNYTWIWDWNKGAWKTIELPPPAPISMAKGTNRDNSLPDWSNLQVLCFNRVKVLSGKLKMVTESGCFFVSSDENSGPQFSLKS